MAWRPNRAKGVVGLTLQDRVHGRAHRARRPEGRLAGLRRDDGVAIDGVVSVLRDPRQRALNVGSRMNPGQLLDSSQRGITPLQRGE